MGFQHGIGGINAAAKQLDVIGNNVANSGTIGFKGSRAEFADMYAANFYGVAATQTGLGVRTETIAQQFNQGGITTTGNQMDMAISGNGFFVLNDVNGVSYSRNGQFKIDREGFIVNNGGSNLQGWAVDENTGRVLEGTQTSMRVDNSLLEPRPTDFPAGAGEIKWAFNLDSRQTSLDPANFDPANPATYNHTTSTNIYDSLGNPYKLNLYFVKDTAGGGAWQVFARGIDETVSPNAVVDLGQQALTFDTEGKLPTGPNLLNFTAFDPSTLGVPVNAAPININIDFANTTQFGAQFSNNDIIQPGYPPSVVTNLEVSKDGVVSARYSNGQNKTIGQVILANFPNQQGLQSIGNNRWIQTYQSGTPTLNNPGSTNTGLIQSQALEEANVDLTAELVNMITAQRFYQANAQTIKVQDAVLQSVINLR